MADGAVSARLTGMALEPKSSTPEDLGSRTRDGYARISKVIKDANIKAD